MQLKLKIEIPHEKVVEFCRKNHIRKLSFFGSVLRGDFSPESDIDVLVEFIPGMGPGYIGLSQMERELTGIFDRKIDLRTPNELSKYFREEVITSALVEYAKG
ncbi:MAG: nucleotidyltransferase family protein [Deltaproteobacteria bacterium]|nr:nucleotidyltransferase family protein [Deltaproteobacteria bacterium]